MDIETLVRNFTQMPGEVEWVEFKENLQNPDDIGEYISALSNAASLDDQHFAFMIWGIQDNSHAIVGTTFSPHTQKIGNEDLEGWLNKLVSPKVDFRFNVGTIEGKKIVVMRVPCAHGQPTQFKKEEYIRVGSYKKKLRDQPAKEQVLWSKLNHKKFDLAPITEPISDEDILKLLDYNSYFDLMNIPIPEGKKAYIDAFVVENIIIPNNDGKYFITNMGALLFARKISDFKSISRKNIRVIQYKENSRIETIKEPNFNKGYASGFTEIISAINNLIPANEIMGTALRRSIPMYPELSVRELVANALIHQDFRIAGAGPMVEIFKNRMEITNPGTPLVPVERFLDIPPRSRNEDIASLMRRAGICEERGSGIDKVVFQAELYQLPAPLFEVVGENTKVVLKAHQALSEMDKDDRIRACYLHACLKWVEREAMTNSTVRKRFGIEQKNSAQASRIIKEALDSGLILPYDENAAPKLMRYIPFWVRAQEEF